jgi:hypothetical protein
MGGTVTFTAECQSSRKEEAMRAMTWFKDCTYLGHDPEWKDRIFRECIEQGHIALIDYKDDMGWVFHTLYPPDGTVSRKDIAIQFAALSENVKDERGLEDRIVKSLKAQGHRVRRQVYCRAGIADIVTNDAVIEVKYYLSSDKLFEAVGQVLMYRHVINPSARAVIVVASIDRHAPVEVARELGVEIIEWGR